MIIRSEPSGNAAGSRKTAAQAATSPSSAVVIDEEAPPVPVENSVSPVPTPKRSKATRANTLGVPRVGPAGEAGKPPASDAQSAPAAVPGAEAGADEQVAVRVTEGKARKRGSRGAANKSESTGAPISAPAPAVTPPAVDASTQGGYPSPKALWAKSQLGQRYPGRPWRDEVIAQISKIEMGTNDVTITMKNGDVVRDRRSKLLDRDELTLRRPEEPRTDPDAKKLSLISAQAVLEMARSKGWQTLEINGDDDFVEDLVNAALDTNYFKACDLIGANSKIHLRIRELCIAKKADPDFIPQDLNAGGPASGPVHLPDPLILEGVQGSKPANLPGIAVSVRAPAATVPSSSASAGRRQPSSTSTAGKGLPPWKDKESKGADPREIADRLEEEAQFSDAPGMG